MLALPYLNTVVTIQYCDNSLWLSQFAKRACDVPRQAGLYK